MIVGDAGDVLALELWDGAGAGPVAAALGFALPTAGCSAGDDVCRAMRFEPNVWLVEGSGVDARALAAAVAGHGAVTAIGGGLVRVTLRGAAWRALLMHDGVFDAEDVGFGPGRTAATVIAHVAVRLHVVREDRCDALVPASLADGLLARWRQAAWGLRQAQGERGRS
ncbi:MULTISPECIES: sarcosine oxidase subunit gamma family protein [unclassified Novosphingobium]|uniref:sarcosine oxidase subunit gamma family protein n=1 Tax=unclassified Novosphingobium TaxID=2644732 RepID=UPI00200718D7|nr:MULTISPECIES: sarcosine oxidase subunit gamma family protein [unclassified Novosphingobium]